MGKLQISPAVAAPCEEFVVTVLVSNTGDVNSDEVVQVYAQWQDAPLPTPQRQLVAFERIHVKTGEEQEVKFVIKPAQLAMVDDSEGDVLPVWVAAPTQVSLFVGGQQPDQQVAAPSAVLEGSCSIVGVARRVDKCGSFNSEII